MIPRRCPTATAPQHGGPSTFDRVTFTTCMLTIAVALAALAGYGPAAAMAHILDVLRTGAVQPITDADLYALAVMPY